MNKILIVIDMQNDFIDGALGTAEACEIVPAVAERIRAYEPGNVYATRDTHEEHYMDTQEGRNLPVAHCIRGSEGWQIRPEIAEALGDAPVFDKPTFGSTALADAILERSKKEEIGIEICGLCTDICVVSNALLLKAYMPEVPITVDARLCAGVTPESHEKALATMQMCQVKVTGTD